MRYWLDTEFIEDGTTIDLISIGIVCEDGREFYAINLDCDLSKASQWVKDNVIALLPPVASDISGHIIKGDHAVKVVSSRHKSNERSRSARWMRKNAIRAEVAFFLGCEQINPLNGFTYVLPTEVEEPEVWAYYADYDWVVFCQLFGTMMDLPKGFPMYCRDIKQECDRLGNPKLPEQGKGSHNALEDARWNKQAWEFLRDLEQKE